MKKLLSKTRQAINDFDMIQDIAPHIYRNEYKWKIFN